MSRKRRARNKSKYSKHEASGRVMKKEFGKLEKKFVPVREVLDDEGRQKKYEEGL